MSKKIVFTSCPHDCGGKCLLKVYVENGIIKRIETDDGEEPQLRACLRGRSQRKRVYSQDRLKQPMVRVGERGEEKFKQVSWDEALNLVATTLKKVRDTYGPEAILYVGYGGNSSALFHSNVAVYRLLNMFGGCTPIWGDASCEGAVFACRATYGTLTTGHTRDDLPNSRLIIMWGFNPAETIFSTDTRFNLIKAKEAGSKIVCVDPRFTDSAAVFAEEWVPVRPTTDVAMLAAMAYVIINEGLYDKNFVEKFTVGFEKFRDYLLGVEDGVPKTPGWAEKISGVSAQKIEKLAREYATLKPAALLPGYAPGRTAYGEQFHRMTIVLAAITGNIGVYGGNPAGMERAPVGIMFGETLPAGANPVLARYPYIKDQLLRPIPRGGTIHISKVWDAILNGKAGGYPADVKLVYVTNANPLNQFPNTNKGVEALKKVEFIVVHEQFMTSTAKFADVLLPVKTHFERNDIVRPWLSGPYYFYLNQVIEPLYECKSDFEICCELAYRLGIQNYDEDKGEEEWLKEIFQRSPDLQVHVKNYEEFKRKGVWKIKLEKPLIALKEQIQDPEHNSFPTPSGKIEIYSERLGKLNNPKIPPIPKYFEAWEGPNDPEKEKYPLQLISPHSKRRAHSVFDNISWLRKVEPQQLWINPIDAEAREIKSGELVKVFNDRGTVVIQAKVTERIMPGVVSLCEGAWYNPDRNGLDHGGCPNLLSKDEFSPAGAFCTNSCIVEVQK
jgi:anaerobic dimethyl sulfoxide reductase subunit A